MTATTAVGGLAATDGPNAKAFVDALWMCLYRAANSAVL